MRILSIDDSKSVHAFITACLKDSGHDLKHAYDGREGLAMLEGLEVDVILLDWEMPQLAGPDVLIEILKRRPGMNVIMVTTKNAPEEIQKVLDLGAKDYVMKPFTRDILLGKLEMV